MFVCMQLYEKNVYVLHVQFTNIQTCIVCAGEEIHSHTHTHTHTHTYTLWVPQSSM